MGQNFVWSRVGQNLRSSRTCTPFETSVAEIKKSEDLCEESNPIYCHLRLKYYRQKATQSIRPPLWPLSYTSVRMLEMGFEPTTKGLLAWVRWNRRNYAIYISHDPFEWPTADGCQRISESFGCCGSSSVYYYYLLFVSKPDWPHLKYSLEQINNGIEAVSKLLLNHGQFRSLSNESKLEINWRENKSLQFRFWEQSFVMVRRRK